MATPVGLSALVDATRSATVTLRARGNWPRRVYQCGAELVGADQEPSTAGSARCQMRWNGYLVTPAKPVPIGDAIVGPPYVDIAPGDELTVTVNNANSGDLLKCLFLFDELGG